VALMPWHEPLASAVRHEKRVVRGFLVLWLVTIAGFFIQQSRIEHIASKASTLAIQTVITKRDSSQIACEEHDEQYAKAKANVTALLVRNRRVKLTDAQGAELVDALVPHYNCATFVYDRDHGLRVIVR
jgi:hypothetical protein